MGCSDISHPTSFYNFLSGTKIDLKSENGKECVPDKTEKQTFILSSVLHLWHQTPETCSPFSHPSSFPIIW